MPRAASSARIANSASRSLWRNPSRSGAEERAMIRSRRSRKRSFFSTACMRSSIFDSQRSTTSSERTAPRRSSVSWSARIPVWATKRFFSRLPIDSKRDLTASAVRLTTSSSVEIRSSRCSSNGISSWGSPLSSTTPTPESTRSFELQRRQNSSSSEFLRPQTWQYIRGSRGVLVEALAGLLAEPPRIHHADEERARAVLRVAEAVLEDAEDRQARVEADEVRELE